jgi:hypothetical protein
MNDDLQTAADTHNFLLKVIQVHRQTQDLARKINENNFSFIIYIYIYIYIIGVDLGLMY